MISRFDSWLFEEEKKPAKPALYKVGDQVLMKDGEQYSIESLGKYISAYCDQGGLAEITKAEIKNGSWIYYLKMITGVVYTYGSKKGSGSSYTSKDNKNIRSKQSSITTENLEKFLKLWKTAKFSVGQEVIYKNATKTVRSVAIKSTIKESKVFYTLTGVSDTIEESHIREDEKLSPDKEEILMYEIAKKLKINIKQKAKDDYSFDVQTIELGQLLTGLMFFRTEAELTKFTSELLEFIDSKADKDLQICLNSGSPAPIKAKNAITWRGGSIYKINLREAARNLGIDTVALFHKMRGTLSSKKYGV